MDPIVIAAGTALVGAMATDAWQQVRASVAALWRKVYPQQEHTIERDLEGLRSQVLDARQAGSVATEQALTGAWQLRIQQLLREDSALAAELRRLLDETLTPALTPAEQTRIGHIIMTATAHDHTQITQVAGNQYNIKP